MFLQRYVSFADQEYNAKFKKGIDTENRYNMGIREQVLELAKKEGMEKGVEKVVKNMLGTKQFSEATIANLVGVSEDFVKKIKHDLKN